MVAEAAVVVSGAVAGRGGELPGCTTSAPGGILGLSSSFKSGPSSSSCMLGAGPCVLRKAVSCLKLREAEN